MLDRKLVETLISQVNDPASRWPEIQPTMSSVLSASRSASGQETRALLQRLADDVIDVPNRPDLACRVALACGALVESGHDPAIAIGAILDRLENDVLPAALHFIAACRDAALDQSRSPLRSHEPDDSHDSDGVEKPRDENADPVEAHGERLSELMPESSLAFQSIQYFSMAAVAMLSRSVALRKATWERVSLRDLLDAMGGQYGYADYLWRMFQVLDDEVLVVLHPEQGKGYFVRLHGLGDNFQLHTLVAAALVGRFSGKWIRGRRPTRLEIRNASGGTEHPPEGVSHGVFNLWSWRGVDENGQLLNAQEHADFWVWNEGVPAQIPTLDGTRLLILGAPPYRRSWTASPVFPAMSGSVEVDRVLTRDETQAWLDYLAKRVAGSHASEPPRP